MGLISSYFSKDATEEHKMTQEELFREDNSVGDHVEAIIYGCIYGGELKKIQRLGSAEPWVWIRFHHDGEWKNWSQEKFEKMKKECEDTKKRLGIKVKIIGRLSIVKD